MKLPVKILSSIIVLYLLCLVLLQPNGKEPTTVAQRRQGGTTLLSAQKQTPPLEEEPIVSEPVIPDSRPAVKDLPVYELEYHLDREINPRLNFNPNLDPDFRSKGGIDPLLAVQAGVEKQLGDGFTTPILNFEAQDFSGVNPPDTVGDVGPNHYIHIINSGGGALMVIYDKNGTPLAGPTALGTLGTGVCADGWGDGIVLYDRLADRWIISEFAPKGSNTLCVYVSQGPDPVNDGWYAYKFGTPNFPDYPKYGVWPDAYYVSSNEGDGSPVYALDRNQMLTGGPATSVRFTAPSLSGFGFQALTPSDLDGATAPPLGSPNYIMRHRDDEVHAGTDDPDHDFLEIWAFDVDFDTPANSSFTQIADIEIAEIDSDLCGLSSFFCFPQPNSDVTLDPLREVVMWRLQYRHFGSHEVLVGNLVTDVSGNDHGGIRWFELRKSGKNAWSLFQEGTFAPDEHHRWMGSVAMDGSGNMALGYSVTSDTVFPGIRYVGRLANDPAGTMPHGEVSIVSGSGSNASVRWGDYSAMSVDPADDCTFWYTNMYSPSSNWRTRIATFKFDDCGEGGATATPTPTNTPGTPTATPTNTPGSPTLTPTPTPTPTYTPGGTTIYLPLVIVPPIPVSLGLTPFDANLNDLSGPSSWSSNYGKTPEIIVSSNGVELDVLAQDYDSETALHAVLLHIEPNSSGYEITQALTDMPMLDRVMGLATDDAGNRYYATGVDESDIVDSTYPPLDTYRSNIVRVIKLNRAGNVQFNIDLDTARYAYNNKAEMIINPMVAATSRLVVGGNEIGLVHGINTDPDSNIGGARHQKALSTRLDATSGVIMQTSSVWVSHSFDHRLLYDGEGIIEHHLGDAYPRYIVLARNHTSYPLFHIKGDLGENNTRTRLGNIALIENDSVYDYIALFATENSADTGSTINGPRNLAIVRVNGNDNSIDPSLPDTLTVTSIDTQYTNRLRWLTDYSASSNLHAERPKLIGIGEDQYVVLWEEWLDTDTFNGVYAMVIDDKGNILRAATLITNQHHLHRGDDAFLLDKHAAWMTGNTVEQKLYIHLVDASLNYEIVTFDVGGD